MSSRRVQRSLQEFHRIRVNRCWIRHTGYYWIVLVWSNSWLHLERMISDPATDQLFVPLGVPSSSRSGDSGCGDTDRRSYNQFGTLVWQLNEIWPTGGWGFWALENWARESFKPMWMDRPFNTIWLVASNIFFFLNFPFQSISYMGYIIPTPLTFISLHDFRVIHISMLSGQIFPSPRFSWAPWSELTERQGSCCHMLPWWIHGRGHSIYIYYIIYILLIYIYIFYY